MIRLVRPVPRWGEQRSFSAQPMPSHNRYLWICDHLELNVRSIRREALRLVEQCSHPTDTKKSQDFTVSLDDGVGPCCDALNSV